MTYAETGFLFVLVIGFSGVWYFLLTRSTYNDDR
jgi:hypothetical protein